VWRYITALGVTNSNINRGVFVEFYTGVCYALFAACLKTVEEKNKNVDGFVT